MAYHSNFISCLVSAAGTVRFDSQVWSAQNGVLDAYKGRRVCVRRGVLGYDAEVVRQGRAGYIVVAELFAVPKGELL